MVIMSKKRYNDEEVIDKIGRKLKPDEEKKYEKVCMLFLKK